MERLKITKIDIPYEGDPLRLCVVADLHKGDPKAVAKAVIRLAPDACLIPGDLFESPPRRKEGFYESGMKLLRMISPYIPVFYAPGNHDCTIPLHVRVEMEHLGTTVLEETHKQWGNIWLGGIPSSQYKKKRMPNLEYLKEFSSLEGYKLLLCHHPEYYRYLKEFPINLVVSGHAHGGQWSLFGKGLYSPGQGLFPRYTKGLYHGNLVVTRGVGDTTLIPRICTPREILLLTLGKDGKNA